MSGASNTRTVQGDRHADTIYFTSTLVENPHAQTQLYEGKYQASMNYNFGQPLVTDVQQYEVAVAQLSVQTQNIALQYWPNNISRRVGYYIVNGGFLYTAPTPYVPLNHNSLSSFPSNPIFQIGQLIDSFNMGLKIAWDNAQADWVANGVSNADYPAPAQLAFDCVAGRFRLLTHTLNGGAFDNPILKESMSCPI